ncbi:MAG: glycerol-3-phosphate transporter [Elusimicrobia bacterium CG08_land_8_20_14_0_20_59_10]|nr:MAG: glycerol-3-phosphate transporter [Elusimicrobia bacterium CG08_land_8_20_14_0_20_59_10]
MSKLFDIYKPAPFTEPLPKEKIESTYTRMRWKMMLSVFAGYAFFYFVRNTFSLAKPYLIKDYGMSKGDVGLIATALAISYGLSKFIMGNVSDRSNPRYFMATGLILSGVVNLIFPSFAGSVAGLFALWFVNGWAQGMGWPPCARTLTHWFSDGERGRIFSVWNLAHNVGGGLVGPIVNGALALAVVLAGGAALSAGFTFHIIFYVPAVLAIIMGVLILVFLRDTPQSCGLPSIEDFKNDHPDTGVADPEKELTAKEIFVTFVLKNKPLWIIAIANVFIYVVRYGVLNWAPTYLTAVKACPPGDSRWLFFLYEVAGIPGTLLAGWASDKLFGGRRSPVSCIFMVLVTIAVWLYWKNPAGNFMVDAIALFTIGFLIYGPVMLIGVSAVDLAPKKAAGTAAGFTGFFGYVFGAVIAELGLGRIVDRWGWDGGFTMLLAACVTAVVLFAITWNVHHKPDRE